jgi:hypothetical protein
MHGACVLNTQYEQENAQGSAPFCVATSDGTLCYYHDISLCSVDAKLLNGICVARAK